MAYREKVIITCAITGSVHTPTMSPYLPITPEQIADEAVKAAEAGAAIVHIHARDPKTGMPSSDLNIFREILTRIKERSDVVICVTTGGGIGMTTEERIAVVPEFEPELCSFNMGSMNFALPPEVIKRIKVWKYDWEKVMAEMSQDFVFKNTFKDLRYFVKTMYEHGTKPECECYCESHLYNLWHLLREGTIKKPLWIQFCLGMYGGIGATIEDLVHMKETAERLFGPPGPDNWLWSALAAGRWEFPICTAAAAMGGHVRVGMEDNLFLKRGVPAKSNAELVEKMVHLIEEVVGWREIASPDDARRILGLKGKDKVKF